MRAWLRGAAALLVASAPLACERTATPEPPPSPAPSAQDATPEAAGVRYLEQLTGGAAASERLPMIVAIHGLGDRPSSFAPVLGSLHARARLIVPYGEPWGEGFSWFPVGALDDEALLEAGTARAADRLAAMIEALSRSRPTVGKAIVTGFSQGGMLSFTLAVRHPELVAAAFPVGGLMAPRQVPAFWPMGREQPPIAAFHGSADERVPVARARATVAQLRGLGLGVTLTEYPGVGHTITPQMRADLLRAIDAAAGRVSASGGASDATTK